MDIQNPYNVVYNSMLTTTNQDNKRINDLFDANSETAECNLVTAIKNSIPLDELDSMSDMAEPIPNIIHQDDKKHVNTLDATPLPDNIEIKYAGIPQEYTNGVSGLGKLLKGEQLPSVYIENNASDPFVSENLFSCTIYFPSLPRCNTNPSANPSLIDSNKTKDQKTANQGIYYLRLSVPDSCRVSQLEAAAIRSVHYHLTQRWTQCGDVSSESSSSSEDSTYSRTRSLRRRLSSTRLSARTLSSRRSILSDSEACTFINSESEIDSEEGEREGVGEGENENEGVGKRGLNKRRQSVDRTRTSINYGTVDGSNKGNPENIPFRNIPEKSSRHRRASINSRDNHHRTQSLLNSKPFRQPDLKPVHSETDRDSIEHEVIMNNGTSDTNIHNKDYITNTHTIPQNRQFNFQDDVNITDVDNDVDGSSNTNINNRNINNRNINENMNHNDENAGDNNTIDNLTSTKINLNNKGSSSSSFKTNDVSDNNDRVDKVNTTNDSRLTQRQRERERRRALRRERRQSGHTKPSDPHATPTHIIPYQSTPYRTSFNEASTPFSRSISNLTSSSHNTHVQPYFTKPNSVSNYNLSSSPLPQISNSQQTLPLPLSLPSHPPPLPLHLDCADVTTRIGLTCAWVDWDLIALVQTCVKNRRNREQHMVLDDLIALKKLRLTHEFGWEQSGRDTLDSTALWWGGLFSQKRIDNVMHKAPTRNPQGLRDIKLDGLYTEYSNLYEALNELDNEEEEANYMPPVKLGRSNKLTLEMRQTTLRKQKEQEEKNTIERQKELQAVEEAKAEISVSKLGDKERQTLLNQYLLEERENSLGYLQKSGFWVDDLFNCQVCVNNVEDHLKTLENKISSKSAATKGKLTQTQSDFQLVPNPNDKPNMKKNNQKSLNTANIPQTPEHDKEETPVAWKMVVFDPIKQKVNSDVPVLVPYARVQASGFTCFALVHPDWDDYEPGDYGDFGDFNIFDLHKRYQLEESNDNIENPEKDQEKGNDIGQIEEKSEDQGFMNFLMMMQGRTDVEQLDDDSSISISFAKPGQKQIENAEDLSFNDEAGGGFSVEGEGESESDYSYQAPPLPPAHLRAKNSLYTDLEGDAIDDQGKKPIVRDDSDSDNENRHSKSGFMRLFSCIGKGGKKTSKKSNMDSKRGNEKDDGDDGRVESKRNIPNNHTLSAPQNESDDGFDKSNNDDDLYANSYARNWFANLHAQQIQEEENNNDFDMDDLGMDIVS